MGGTIYKAKFLLKYEPINKKQWNILLKFKKGKKNAKSMQKNHWKTLFSSKNLLGKKNKEEKAEKGGGLLIRGGAHIRDNTVFV